MLGVSELIKFLIFSPSFKAAPTISYFSRKTHATLSEDKFYALTAFYIGVKLEYKRSGNFIAVRLDEDERIVEKIEEVCSKENVASGVIISAVGALKECKLIFRRGCQEEFHEHFEIIGNGNISMLEGKPKIHLHIAGGNDSRQVSGHLVEGVVTVFCEIMIQVLHGFKMEREKDTSLVSQHVLNPYVLRP